jgi:type IV secretion system protein TrbB
MSALSAESARRTDARLTYYLGEFVELLSDVGLCELSVNPDGQVFASMVGNPHMIQVGTIDHARATAFLYSVASLHGKVIDRDSDASLLAELPSYAPWSRGRLQGFVSPASDGTTFTIRMHAKSVFTLQDYLYDGILSERHYESIINAIRQKKCILVVGGTESGKTTFLNAVVAAIADVNPQTRLVILEGAREIQSTLENTVNILTHGSMDMVAMLSKVMKQRPDMIVIGEVTDHAAAMFIRAQKTGHHGGMCTIHSGTARGGLEMLESYISQGAIRPSRKEIADAVDIVCFIKKDPSHPKGRRVESLVEVRSTLSPDGDYILAEV